MICILTESEVGLIVFQASFNYFVRNNRKNSS